MYIWDFVDTRPTFKHYFEKYQNFILCIFANCASLKSGPDTLSWSIPTFKHYFGKGFKFHLLCIFENCVSLKSGPDTLSWSIPTIKNYFEKDWVVLFDILCFVYLPFMWYSLSIYLTFDIVFILRTYTYNHIWVIFPSSIASINVVCHLPILHSYDLGITNCGFFILILDKCCMLLADASSVGLPSVNLPSTCHTCLSTYNILVWGEIQNKLWNTNMNTKTNSGIQKDIHKLNWSPLTMHIFSFHSVRLI